MTVTTAFLTNNAYGYPTRGHERRHTPHILAVVHQTATNPYDGQAMALRNQRNGPGFSGNTATWYVDQDGDAVHAVDGTRFASWCSAPERISYLDTTRPSMATVKRHFANGYNPNECVWEQFECVGTGTEPWSAAQFEFVAGIIAARAKLSGLPINRETVVPHRDMNTVNRPSDPWPGATRETRMTRLIALAKLMTTAPTPVTATGGADMLAVVKDIARFKTPRTFTTKVGVLNGYDPAKPGVVVKSATFTNASPASFDAVVSIDQFPVASVTPHGAPFLHVTSGTYAGLYVVAAQVTANLTPDAAPTSPLAPPVPDVKHTVTLQIDGVTSFTKAV